jgi:YVTN family beta-propeller protein
MTARITSINFVSALLLAVVLAVTAPTAFAAGPKAYVGNFKDSTVSVIDTTTGTVILTVPVAAGPHGMIISPDGKTLYVSGEESSTVSVIDTATDRVTGSIEVGKTPHGMAMEPDGHVLLVNVYGEDRVAFVDTATRATIASVDVPKPHTIAVRPDGKLAYVASQQPGKFALVVIDLATRTAVRAIALDKAPRDPEFSYDGKALYFTMAGVNAVEVLDPVTERIVAAVPTGASPHIAGYFRGAPVGTAVVQGPGELLLFDSVTNAPLRSIAVGKQPHWVAVSADGKRAYVTNEGSNDVSVVDLASGQVATIAVGNAPRKVVVQRPAANAAGTTVSIVNFAFAPAELTIAAGDTVTWSNDDGAPHGLAYTDGTQGTNLLLPGAKFVRTFDRPGSYDYVCAVHPYMSGKIVVRAP